MTGRGFLLWCWSGRIKVWCWQYLLMISPLLFSISWRHLWSQARHVSPPSLSSWLAQPQIISLHRAWLHKSGITGKFNLRSDRTSWIIRTGCIIFDIDEKTCRYCKHKLADLKDYIYSHGIKVLHFEHNGYNDIVFQTFTFQNLSHTFGVDLNSCYVRNHL